MQGDTVPAHLIFDYVAQPLAGLVTGGVGNNKMVALGQVVDPIKAVDVCQHGLPVNRYHCAG